MGLSDRAHKRWRFRVDAGLVLLALATMTVTVDGVALGATHPAAKAPRQVGAGVRHASASRGALTGGRSLGSILTPSGTLSPDAQGSFSARGYRMVPGRGGAPRFIKATNRGTSASVAADVNWSDAFGNVGAYSATTINAVAVSGQNIYIGGSFSGVSYDAAVPMNNVAMYNGRGWYSLGTGSANGVNGTVDALAVSGSTVYVGGDFNSAGGASANAIASWNGSHWSALGSGMSDPVSGGTPEVDALAVSGTTLYAGGTFDNAGPAAAHSVAKWNGSAWSALGSGIQNCNYFDTANHCYDQPVGPGQVVALAVSGSNLYVGGAFDLAGGKLISGLALWNGSAWSSVGAGGSVVDGGSLGSVNSIAVSGASVYVGGRFDHVGGTLNSTGGVAQQGTAAASIAQWTGSAWKALGSGANNCSGCGSATVFSVAVWSGRVYMSGSFYGAGGDGTPNTAQWNGATWTTIGPNLNGVPSTLIPTSGGVLATGSFGATADGSVNLNNIALWSGTAWSGYGLGLSYGSNAGSTSVVAAANHTVYVAGNFRTAGQTPANDLAVLNGGRWSTVGGGVSGGTSTPDAILISGPDVYIGGNFTQAGTTAASHIAMWDGKTWHALGSGLDGNVYALTMYNGKLWVGGDFAHAGSVAASDVAIWDPAHSTWSKVGGGMHFDGSVNALAGVPAPNNHYMVIGGNFGQVDTGGSNPGYLTVNSIVYFDTTAAVTGPLSGYYDMPGSGTDVGVYDNGSSGGYPGTVDALLVDGTKAFVGGDLDTGGSVASRGFASYDLANHSWASPGAVGGVSGATVNAIIKYGSSYYVAGNFTAAGPIAANDVAQYAPSTGHWTALGSGLGAGGTFGAGATGLAESADGLYVAGGFALAGGKASENLGLWMATAYPVKVSQTVSPTTQTADSHVTFTGTATNHAGSAAGVSMTATLPSNAIYVSASPSQGSCSRSARTLTCSLGTLAAGASATVAITVEPIQPTSVTNSLSVTQTGSPFTSVATTTATVTAQTGTVYAAVSDSGVAPATVTPTLGGLVQYDFYGPAAHTMVEPLMPCTTPSKAPISDYTCRYKAAGAFTAKEDNATTHEATVQVKDVLSASSVTHGTAVTVSVASATPPSGYGEDLEVLAPGGTWSVVKSGGTAVSDSYTPQTAGTYQFRSRLRNLTTNAASGYGPAVSLTAH